MFLNLGLKFHHICFNFKVGFIQFLYFFIQMPNFFITINTCEELTVHTEYRRRGPATGYFMFKYETLF